MSDVRHGMPPPPPPSRNLRKRPVSGPAPVSNLISPVTPNGPRSPKGGTATPSIPSVMQPDPQACSRRDDTSRMHFAESPSQSSPRTVPDLRAPQRYQPPSMDSRFLASSRSSLPSLNALRRENRTDSGHGNCSLPALAGLQFSVPASLPAPAPPARSLPLASSRPLTGPSCRPASLPSRQAASVPSSGPLSVPSSRKVSLPSTRPVSAPSPRPVSMPISQPVPVPASEPQSVPGNGPTTVPVSRSSSVPARSPAPAAVHLHDPDPPSRPSIVIVNRSVSGPPHHIGETPSSRYATSASNRDVSPRDNHDERFATRSTYGSRGNGMSAVAAHEKTPPSEPTSFHDLVNSVIQHPYFSLVVKKVLEAPRGTEIEVRGCNRELLRVNVEVRTLAKYAADKSLEEASATASTLDVYLAALLTALDNLKRSPPGILTSGLRETIAAVRCVTAPGFSGDTEVSGQQYPSFPPRPSPATYPALTKGRAPGPRPKLSAQARDVLEEWFQKNYDNPYPTEEEKRQLSQRCRIRLNQVNNFFGNKRMRLKRKAMSLPCTTGGSGTGPASGTPSGQSVLAPSAKWRSLVLSKIPMPGGPDHDRADAQLVTSEPSASENHRSETGSPHPISPQGSIQSPHKRLRRY